MMPAASDNRDEMKDSLQYAAQHKAPTQVLSSIRTKAIKAMNKENQGTTADELARCLMCLRMYIVQNLCRISMKKIIFALPFLDAFVYVGVFLKKTGDPCTYE